MMIEGPIEIDQTFQNAANAPKEGERVAQRMAECKRHISCRLAGTVRLASCVQLMNCTFALLHRQFGQVGAWKSMPIENWFSVWRAE